MTPNSTEGGTYADGVEAAAKWCDETAAKAEQSGRYDDASMLRTASFCIRSTLLPEAK